MKQIIASKPPRRIWITYIALILYLLLAYLKGPVQADGITIQVGLSEDTIYLGDQVDLHVRVKGLRDPELPELAFSDIEVEPAGGQAYNNSSMTIINGRTRRVEDFGYIARYHLRPLTAGTFHLPAVALTHEGQTYRSKPLTLVVKAPEAQDYLLVEVSSDKPSYILGERITVTLDVALRKLTLNGQELDVDPFFPNEPPHLQVPWFDTLADWKTDDIQTFVKPFLNRQRPGFYINDYVDQGSFFGRDRLTFTLPRQTTHHRRPSGTFAYFTYRLQKTFYPIRAGRVTIPPVYIKAMLPIAIDAQHRAQQTERVVASSQPLTVTVKPVPSAGQPASFSGGVGHFDLIAEASPTTLRVGDPLTLTLRIQGKPNSLIETVGSIPLEAQEEIDKNFKIHTAPPTLKSDDNVKILTYTLRPKHADVHAVPSIEMAYYDPDTARFRTVHSAEIPLTVEGAAPLETSDVVVIGNDTPKSQLGRELAEGLLANYTGPEVLIPQQARFRLTPFIGGLLIGPPLVYLLILIGRQSVRRRRQHPERQRRKRAARTALTALQDLKDPAITHPVNVYEGVQRALTDYLRSKLDLSGAGLTVDDLVQHLNTRHVDTALIEQTSSLFHLCDNARYAPGSLAVMQQTSLIDEATTLIQRLEASPQL